MNADVQKLALTAHVTCSVGWLGAVAGSLVLGVVAFTTDDAELVRAIYRTLEVMGWFVLLPMSLASLATGLLQAMGTAWGLFKHYWVIAKLTINVLASVILLLYMETLGYLADRAADGSLANGALLQMRDPSPILHAAAGLVLLVIATTLSVYKPRGLTPYGRRKHAERRLKATNP
jgi:hypothetical protein